MAQTSRTTENRLRNSQHMRDERQRHNILRKRAVRDQHVATYRTREQQRQQTSRRLVRTSFVRLAFELAPDINLQILKLLSV